MAGKSKHTGDWFWGWIDYFVHKSLDKLFFFVKTPTSKLRIEPDWWLSPSPLHFYFLFNLFMLWIGSLKVVFKARHMATHRPDLWTKVRHNIAQLSERKKEGERANKCKHCKPDKILSNYEESKLFWCCALLLVNNKRSYDLSTLYM